MNRIYRSVWSEVSKTFVAVAGKLLGQEEAAPLQVPRAGFADLVSRPRPLALEQRFMFDGAAAVDAAHALPDAAAAAQIPDVPPPVVVRTADPLQNNGKKEVAFVDTSVTNYQTLEAGIRAGVEVVEIDGGKSGLAQIAQWAESHTGFDAAHIFSHGAAGEISLGSDTLTHTTLQSATAQAELAELGHALKSGGDLLVYGCDVAKGSDGQQLVQDLATLTGADIAASVNLTGDAQSGGDWSLEQNSGVIESSIALTEQGISAYDHSLPVNNAPITGFGSALSFDGTNYVTMSDASYTISGTLTMEAWVNPTSTTGIGQIMGKWGANGTTINERGYLLTVESGHIGVWLSEDGLADTTHFTSSATVGSGVWTHVALVFDTLTSSAQLYINGVLDTNYQAVPGSLFQGTTTDFCLGASYISTGAALFYNGKIDEARVWDTARTADEIKSSMYHTLKGNEAGLVGYWNFDEGSGTTVVDSSRHFNDGTLTGTPAFVGTTISEFITVSSQSATGVAVQTFGGSDADNDGDTQSDTLTVKITALPTHGTLYQTTDGTTPTGGALTLGSVVTNTAGKVIYVSDGVFVGTDQFSYTLNDGHVDAANAVDQDIEVILPDSDSLVLESSVWSSPTNFETANARDASTAVALLDFSISDMGADGFATVVTALDVDVTGTATDAERNKMVFLLLDDNTGNQLATGSYVDATDKITFSGLNISVVNYGEPLAKPRPSNTTQQQLAWFEPSSVLGTIFQRPNLSVGHVSRTQR